MRKLLFFICFAVCSQLCFSQKTESITIIQKKTKHQIKLFAVNHTQNAKKILVQLEGTGFRRKTFAPIYKTINPNDTLLLTILIKRSNTNLKLNYELYFDTRLELYHLQQSRITKATKKRT
ncbi:MAG: hypothetical protein COA88_12365 [Kordia sp.]|nr:MAG: hypothetical protein COA88_12365 [Kordia sp.]